MKKVTIYTASTCHFCHMAKDFFREKGVAFEEFDVGVDVAKRQEMMQKSGQMGVPVIVIDNKEVIIGFNQPLISQLLGI
ncbi:MAG: hypothetical protein UV64_C0004G0006 [Parcubacteria group bacterium GW2011_GWC1_43_11b]|uniref:NrdH-redoxin n=2 Tax=Candidatus Vogeliibacteriota TaxID=1817922 RepID=A0A1G2QC54_9BACT|nr:MAG: hypothetical protein UV50_C0009G0013 [Parcubacteria group bacterium GW2011_GWB1_42_9]KKS89538.1 MAG: hypothetical protein UV64_C0004G0006 [Parcubacteria group bacterium GW2011_GWC1_43_11b]KKT09856.1 MAG: hypothetical protein UV88_C0004G0007 [Parcubacteria group bacterium GW2011_GWA1_43_21]OHA58154.1 MAG: NrdH-redoxin [Candidatus Vogelbacteria bacterium RIFOXYB1_FULL_42_16]OHA59315.1 MAG: NrdH-redoxin [Candidatus Vogelbacteria bacterium RIFOXYD1_FULL_42_15]